MNTVNGQVTNISGYAMCDFDGTNLVAGTQTKTGLFRRLSEAMGTGKVVIATHVLKDGHYVSGIPIHGIRLTPTQAEFDGAGFHFEILSTDSITITINE